MNDSALITVGLPIALGIIMFGLGLSLTPGDFRRVAREPKAVVVALIIQVLVLPVLTFGLVVVADLPPLLAVGVMLLVSSPGGTTANLLSHLFRGDVALNISLTAVNSVLSVVTIPLVTNFAINHFGAASEIGLQFTKILQVMALVLIPVALGMVVRAKNPTFARRSDTPVRLFSIVVLVTVSLGAIIGERENIGEYFSQVGWVVTVVCAASLTIGYLVASLLKLGQSKAIACGMEIGIHNTTVAMTIALSVIDNTTVAVPAAVYSIVMYVLAPMFGWLVTRRTAVNAVRSSDDRQVV